MSSFPTGISSMKLKVSTFEQEISSASLGNNSIQINEEIKNAFNNSPSGTIFNPSIAVTYSDTAFPSVSEILTPTVIPNYVPKKITPSISLEDIPNKLTTDASFSIASLVSKTGTGVLYYEIENESVATVDASGVVTINGAGTTTITVSLAASADQVYAATSVSISLTVSKAIPRLVLSQFALTKFTTDNPFSVASLVSEQEGTGVLYYEIENESVATVDASGVVTINGAGTTTITVSLAASADQVYAATSVSISLTVSKAIPRLVLSQFALTKFTTDNPFSVAELVSEQEGTGVLYYEIENESVATVDASGVVTINGAGTTTITVSLAASADQVYAATSVSISLTVSLPEPTWTQLGEDIDGEAIDDQSGFSVSLSSNETNGTIVAIGAPYNDQNGNNSGHVRVYQLNQTSSLWEQLGQDIDGEAGGDYSGYSVSLSANESIVAIGAPYNDQNGNNSSHVRVYQLNQTSSLWEQLGQDIDGEELNNGSGWSVSLSADGSIVAIGAIFNSDVDMHMGHVRVYAYNGTNWVQLGQDINGEAAYNQSGWSVSLSADGSIVAIGAPYNHGNGQNSGHVRVYAYNGTNWVQLGQDIDGEELNNGSGWSVSLSAYGSIVAIGAIFNSDVDMYMGHVRVYQLNQTSSLWEQLGQDINGDAAENYSGHSVSLSADGYVVAIGATGNNGNTGHVRVYAYNGTNWVQRGTDIDGEAADNKSGWSVSLSADGYVVAIGAPLNDENGNISGHVRVYKYE